MADVLENNSEGQADFNEEFAENGSNVTVSPKKPVTGEPTIPEEEVLADDNEVTEDILQQALSEASAGTLDHIEQTNLDVQASELYTKAVEDETPVTKTQSLESNVINEPQTQSGSNISQSTAPRPPLGSKSNPIRIVQQGNTYTSMQELSQDQIQQIVRVLQQQNVQNVEGASKAVFNAETNTRIVYKVVPPKPVTSESDEKATTPGVMTARQYHEQKYGKVNIR